MRKMKRRLAAIILTAALFMLSCSAVTPDLPANDRLLDLSDFNYACYSQNAFMWNFADGHNLDYCDFDAWLYVETPDISMIATNR